MKAFFKTFLFIVSSFVLAVSCGKNKDGISIIGSWELCDYQTKSVTIGQQPVSVFVNFASDGTFELRQKTGSEQRFTEYTGTWNLAGDMLSGKYEDGSSWASTYTVALSSERLTLTSSTVPAEVMTFRKAQI